MKLENLEKSKEIISRGDIVIANNQNAIKHIQKGYRPYLVISNNKNNQYSEILTVIPLTTQQKKNIPTHYYIYTSNTKGIVLAEQITCISKNDIISKVGNVKTKDLLEIEKRIKIQLGL